MLPIVLALTGLCLSVLSTDAVSSAEFEKAARVTVAVMVNFSSKPFRGKREQEAYDKTFAGRYQKLLKKNHFLYFGLPFMLLIVAGLIYLQKFTAVKWERYDERHRQLNEEEMLNMVENKRPVDKRDDYYRLQGLLTDHLEKEVKPNDDYEIVRVSRRPEDEPVWDAPK